MDRRGALLETLSLLALCAMGVLIWTLRLDADPTRPLSIFGSSDQFNYYYPMYHEAARRIAQGQVPLWNPWQLAGTPFLATIQTAVLYPPNLLHLLLSTERAMQALSLFHLLLAGCLTYALSRTLGVSRAGSLVGGLVYSFSSFLIFARFFPPSIATLAWIPAPFIAATRIHRGGGAGASAALGASVGLLLLAGYISFAVYALQALAAYTLWNMARTWIARRAMGPVVREAAWIGLGVLLGILLTAPQWAPTLELSRLSTRRPGGLTDAQIEPFGVQPFSYLRVLLRPGNEGGAHVGTVTLLLLLPALLRRRLRGDAVFFLVLTISAALLLVGSSTPVFALYKALPGGRTFRIPLRFVSLFAFGASVTASIGAEALLSRGAEENRRRLQRILSVAGGALVLIWARVGLAPWLVAGAAILLSAATAIPRRALLVARIVVVAAIFVNLFFASRSTEPTVWGREGLSMIREYNGLYARLRGNLDFSRAIVLPNLAHVASLHEKQATLQHVFLFQDYEPVSIARYAYYAAFTQRGMLATEENLPYYGSFEVKLPLPRPRLLAAAGVAEVIRLEDDRGGRSRFRVERVPDPLPRAYIVHGLRAATSPFDTLSAISNGDLDLKGEVILESPPYGSLHEAGRPEPKEGVDIVRYEPETVDLQARLSRPGAVVLLDLDFPEWTARVDGRPSPIYNANYLFRALLLPAGAHEIQFRYSPRSFRMGLVGGATGGAGLVGLGLIAMASRRRGLA